jgi:hypothetical protein
MSAVPHGGSRFQIGGPAGASIGLVAGVVERHGYCAATRATRTHSSRIETATCPLRCGFKRPHARTAVATSVSAID